MSLPPSVLALVLAAAACAPSITVPVEKYQRASAGVIGCPSSEIAISGQPEVVRSTPVEWRAECRGRRFVCSGSGDTVQCAPELEPAGATR